MTFIVRCEDKHRLVSCLYGECSPDEQAAVQSHLATCGDCAAEFAGLQDVRGHLAGWQAPDADLGFTVTRSARASRSGGSGPAVVGGTGVGAGRRGRARALGRGRDRESRDPVRRRRLHRPHGMAAGAGRRRRLAAPAAAVAPVRTASVDAGAWKTAIAESEKRLRVEFASNRPTAPQPLARAHRRERRRTAAPGPLC